MKPTCIALDFDFTLTHFVGGLDSLYTIFTRRGVAPEIVREAHQQTERGGFTIDKFTANVKKCVPELLQETTVAAEFTEWLHTSLVPYPDTRSFFVRWFGKIPLAIVTFGDPSYQKQKIDLMNFPHDSLFTIAPTYKKTEALCTLIARHGRPILFVDDKPEELDAVRDDLLSEDDVVTVLMRRPDGIYLDTPHHNHERVASLCEVDHIIITG